MKAILVATAIFVSCFAGGCTDASRSQWTALNKPHAVELYSGGKMVRSWTSTGKVLTEENSDGYYFRDSKTRRLVRVTGDLVIYPR